VILLDTHVLLWLFSGALHNVPVLVRRRLDREPLGVSPFAQLELDYLHEIGRTRGPSDVVVEGLSTRLALSVVDASSAAVYRAAQALTWTRDPFDRLIAAHAIVAGLPLVTKDETIRRNLPLAWWGD
jgi:PIN domain nuclease of toxin-antitoxin system